MKLHKAFWGLPLFGVLATQAIADRYFDDNSRNHRFEQRLDRQHSRIKQGIRSGELTRNEAKRLRNQQRKLVGLERRFTHDGFLDRHERRQLRRNLNAASDRIYRPKHNDRSRGICKGRLGRYGEYDRYRRYVLGYRYKPQFSDRYYG